MHRLSYGGIKPQAVAQRATTLDTRAGGKCNGLRSPPSCVSTAERFVTLSKPFILEIHLGDWMNNNGLLDR
jgi:hypothetical protein